MDVDVDVYDMKLQNLMVHSNWDNQCSFKPIFVSSLQMILQYMSPEYHCTCITMKLTYYPSISHIHIFLFSYLLALAVRSPLVSKIKWVEIHNWK